MGYLQNARKYLQGAALLISGMAAMLAWTIASPIGASPDDNYHLASIWCGRGAVDGQCEVVSDTLIKTPSPLVYGTWCYIFDRHKSAECQEKAVKDWSDSTLVIAPWNNHTAQLYPKGYYFLQSFLVFPSNLIGSILSIRVANTILALFLWGLLFYLGRGTSVQSAFVISILFLSVPLGVFIIASNNPSSWAVISQSTFWGFFYLLAHHVAQSGNSNNRKGILLWICTVTSAYIGIFARADAPVFVVLVMGIILMLQKASFRSLMQFLYSKKLLSSAVLVILAAAVFVFFFQSQGVDVVNNSLPKEGETRRSFSFLLLQNVVNIPMLWHGAVGGWGLGWVDTLMPPVIPLIVFSIFIHFIVSGLNENWPIKRGAVLLLFLALFFIPLQILMNGQYIVGEIVQPRYLLPLLYPTLGIALLNRENLPRPAASSFILYLFGSFLVMAHSLALHVNIRRYITGTDIVGFQLNKTIEWWWDFGPQPMTVWTVGSIGFCAVTALLIQRVVSSGRGLASDSQGEVNEWPDH